MHTYAKDKRKPELSFVSDEYVLTVCRTEVFFENKSDAKPK